MWLESLRAPMARHTRLTDAQHMGHAARALLRRLRRCSLRGQCRQARRVYLASGCISRQITLNPCQTRLVALAPAPHLHTPYIQLRCNILVLHSGTYQQHDPRTLRQPYTGKPRPGQLQQRFMLLQRQIDFRCNSHFSLQQMLP